MPPAQMAAGRDRVCVWGMDVKHRCERIAGLGTWYRWAVGNGAGQGSDALNLCHPAHTQLGRTGHTSSTSSNIMCQQACRGQFPVLEVSSG